MHKSNLQILLVLAVAWTAALCVVVHPLLGLLTAGLFAPVEFTLTREWVDPGTMATVIPMGWALFVLVLSRMTSPATTILFASSGCLIHAIYAMLRAKKEEGYSL